MSGKQQKNQRLLAFMAESRDEVPRAASGGTEPPMAKCEPESLATVEPLMEEVCQRKNLEGALKRVMANKGSPGVDGMRGRHKADLSRPCSAT